MTDAEAVAVLRRLHDTDFDALPDELAAIERAIDVFAELEELRAAIRVCNDIVDEWAPDA